MYPRPPPLKMLKKKKAKGIKGSNFSLAESWEAEFRDAERTSDCNNHADLFVHSFKGQTLDMSHCFRIFYTHLTTF